MIGVVHKLSGPKVDLQGKIWSEIQCMLISLKATYKIVNELYSFVVKVQ